MTATMNGRLCVVGVFLSAIILSRQRVLGKALVDVPRHLSVNLQRETLLLECTVWSTEETEQVSKITWSRNGVYDRSFKTIVEISLPYTGEQTARYRDSSLKRRSNLTVTPGEDGKTVVRLQVKPDCGDRGLFRCEARLQGENQPTAAVVNVTLQEEPQIVSLVQSEEFQCTAALGNPRGTLSWVKVRRDGNYLQNITMGGMTSAKQGLNFCYDVIQSILHADVSGDDVKLICIVTSPLTSVTKEIPISVPYAVKNARIRSFIGGREMAYWVKDVSANEGDEVVFNCSARGRPAPNYKWRQWLSSKSDWVWVNTSGRPWITISNVSSMAEGKYRCTAENVVHGTAYDLSKEIRLTVKEMLQAAPPTVPEKSSRNHSIIIIALFVGIVLVLVAIGVGVMIYCYTSRTRAKRRRKPISHIELEYRPVVNNPSSRRSVRDPLPLPPKARDDFNI